MKKKLFWISIYCISKKPGWEAKVMNTAEVMKTVP